MRSPLSKTGGRGTALTGQYGVFYRTAGAKTRLEKGNKQKTEHRRAASPPRSNGSPLRRRWGREAAQAGKATTLAPLHYYECAGLRKRERQRRALATAAPHRRTRTRTCVRRAPCRRPDEVQQLHKMHQTGRLSSLYGKRNAPIRPVHLRSARSVHTS